MKNYRKCVVRSCSRYQESGTNVSFHRFPWKQESLVKQWLINLKREDNPPVRSSRICSVHFESTSFDIYGTNRKLKLNALPTLFMERPYVETLKPIQLFLLMCGAETKIDNQVGAKSQNEHEDSSFEEKDCNQVDIETTEKGGTVFSSEMSQGESSIICPPYNWDNRATLSLIALCVKFDRFLNTSDLEKIREVWRIVSERMCASGHYVTAMQCAKHWELLQTSYTECLENMNTHGYYRTTFLYFTEMDEWASNRQALTSTGSIAGLGTSEPQGSIIKSKNSTEELNSVWPIEKLNATSLDIDLDGVRDEIKFLRLRIKAMAVHKDLLTKQLNEVNKLEQQLTEMLNGQLDREMKLVEDKKLKADLPRWYNCPVCRTSYTTNRSRLKHIRKSSCRAVSARFSNTVHVLNKSDYLLKKLKPSSLVRYESVIMLREPAVPTVDTSMCYICHSSIAATTDTSDSSRRDNWKVICTTCEGIYPDLCRPESDADETTVEKQFACSMCTQTFSNRWRLLGHTRRHSTEHNLCFKCGKSFRCQAAYQRHANTHCDLTNFKCKTCEKQLCSSSALKRHMLWHNGLQRNYTCDVCGKSFAYDRYLKLHMLSHSSIRPYSCTQCSKTYTRSWQLKKHLTLHTGEMPLKCPLCYKGFRRYNVKKKHMKIHMREGLDVGQQVP